MCPSFMVGGRARAEGYGEKLTPLPDEWPLGWALIVKPSYSHSTPEMFAKLDAVSYPFEDFPKDERQHNDFERVDCEATDIVERIAIFGGYNGGMTAQAPPSLGFSLLEKPSRRLRAGQKRRVWASPGPFPSSQGRKV